jgi:hypothetical protein
MRKWKWPQKGLQSLSPLSPLAHLIMITPFKVFFWLDTSFWNPNHEWTHDHLQLIVFLHPWMLLDKLHELQEMQLTYVQSHSRTTCCNSITILSQFFFQLLCNSSMTTIIMSLWCHFTSIHQNLSTGTMKIFWWFFLNNHKVRWILDGHKLWHGTIKSCHVGY